MSTETERQEPIRTAMPAETLCRYCIHGTTPGYPCHKFKREQHVNQDGFNVVTHCFGYEEEIIDD